MKFGCFEKRDVRDWRIDTDVYYVGLPSYYGLREVLLEPKSQGQVSSCVAHAIATILEYYHYANTGKKRKMSTGYIYGNRFEALSLKEGMYLRDGIKNALNYGDCFEKDFPENVEMPEANDVFLKKYSDDLYSKAMQNSIEGYVKLSNVNEIKRHIIASGPVLMSMEWYDDIQVDKLGILSTKKKHKRKNSRHAMVIYGWNDLNGWMVRNSWGKNWGCYGSCWLPFDIPIHAYGFIEKGASHCEKIKRPYSSKFGKIIAKILNKIINIIN